MKYVKYIILLFASLTSLRGQNLIPNGSFEFIKKKQKSSLVDSGDFDKSIHFWTSPTKGVPQLTSLHKNNANFTDNFRLPNPVEGNFMLALFLSGYTEICDDFREYVQVKLKDTLNTNEKYYLEFWLTSTEADQYEVGIVFSDKAKYDYKVCNIKEDPHLTFTDSIQPWVWKKMSVEFQPKFPISYIMIGNFKKEKDKDYKYCYFDNFKLVNSKFSPTSDSTSLQQEIEIPIQNKFNSPNIHFEIGEHRLLPTSYLVLDSVAYFLEENQSTQLIIEGHTDLSGSEETNNLLSINRANEVKSYLIAKGIVQHRISCFGYGSSRPISKDTNQNGMKINRRVVFKFISNEKKSIDY